MTPPHAAFGELVLHGLAHLPIGDAGCSYAPEYLAWAQHVGATDDVAIADGRRIATCLLRSAASRPTSRHLLHRWGDLHATMAGFDRTRRHALADLGGDDVDDRALLQALQHADDPALELVHAWLALAAPTWTRVYADTIAPALAEAGRVIAPLVAAIKHDVPSLAGRRIELSFVLGPRGRGHRSRIVVGAPAPWHSGDAAQSVVWALHEHAVRDWATGDWADVEWSALRRVCAWVEGTTLVDAHARWLSRLDLAHLLATQIDRGAIDPTLAARVLDEPERRATWLRTA